MNTKRFRAETMRAALEQVKHELGDDALVLDTRRVRAGGLLGFGGRELVEVRVAVGDTAHDGAVNKQFAETAASPAAPRRHNSSTSILNLTDDSPALPAHASEKTAASAVPAFAALAARAYAADPGSELSGKLETAIAPLATSQAQPASREIEKVEIADTAPRFVHRPPVIPPAAGTLVKSTDPASATLNDALAGELERLRAELREVKFSLNAFNALPAARLQAAAARESDIFAAADEIYDSPHYEIYLLLTSAGLQPELARQAVRALLTTNPFDPTAPPLDLQQDAGETAALSRQALAQLLRAEVAFAENFFHAPGNEAKTPAAFAFIGATGVGKTTTIAKLAARFALRERRRVELITLDTYRIAAVEQLKTYAEIIGAGFNVARSIVELDALTQRFAGQATILIDTTGRNPHDLADQIDLADYLRASAHVRKCLVVPATTHSCDALATVKKFALYGADSLALTKFDETMRPGLALQVALEARLPLAYLSAGQRVPEDLERATPEAFASHVLRDELARAAL